MTEADRVVRPITFQEVDAAAGVLANAFSEDPIFGFIFDLESTNPANDAWYARFGFESRGPVPLPSGAPVLTAMWRDAR